MASRMYWRLVRQEAERTGRPVRELRRDPAFRAYYRQLNRTVGFGRATPAERRRHTTATYWRIVRHNAQVTGRTVTQVRADEQFKLNWDRLKYVWERERMGETWDRSSTGPYAQVLRNLRQRMPTDTHRVGDTP